MADAVSVRTPGADRARVTDGLIPFRAIIHREGRDCPRGFCCRRMRLERQRMMAQSRLFLLAAVALLGCALACLATPWLVRWRADVRLDGMARSAAARTLDVPDAERSLMVARARAYNRALLDSGQPMIGDEAAAVGFGSPRQAGFDAARQSDADTEYRALLNGASFTSSEAVMGRVLVPRISVDLPLRHGSDERTLQMGAGHLYGTSLPVGGEGSHTVITAHSGMPYATLFTRLDELSEGDPFYVEVAGMTLAYRVMTITVLDPDGDAQELAMLKASPGADRATLLTCTGQGNTKRLAVTGERNSMPDQAPYPDDAQRDPRLSRIVTVFVMLVTGVAVALLCRTGRRARPPVAHHGSGRFRHSFAKSTTLLA
ncbi:class C sortase [Bifidobacterium leontopitheci]|nr:class C sortase [Bifidobacterium leontopitheci]